MRIAKLDRFDMLNNPGEDKPAFTIWFAGCSVGCKGCHNPTLQDPNSGNDMSVVDIVTAINNAPYDYDTIVFLGGEPLEQDHSDIETLSAILATQGYKIFLYTSWEIDDIPDTIKIWMHKIKTGPYIEEQHRNGFPASTNQKVYERVDKITHLISGDNICFIRTDIKFYGWELSQIIEEECDNENRHDIKRRFRATIQPIFK